MTLSWRPKGGRRSPPVRGKASPRPSPQLSGREGEGKWNQAANLLATVKLYRAEIVRTSLEILAPMKNSGIGLQPMKKLRGDLPYG